MQIFSENAKGKEPATQRRLYTLFQRAIKAGEFSALKLLTRFEIQGTKGPRQVQDYAYTDETAVQVKKWMEQHERTKGPKGYRTEDVRALSDADLAALIQQQAKTPKPRRKRKPKGERTAANDSQIKAPQHTE